MKKTILKLSVIILIIISFWACNKEELRPKKNYIEMPLALQTTPDSNVVKYCMSLIEISEQINYVLSSEQNIDLNYMSNPDIDSLSTFESIFEDAGFSMNVEMSNFMSEVINSTKNLMEESPYLAEMTESQIESIFSIVINDLIEEKEILVGATPGSICRTRYDNAVSKCNAMAAIGYTAVGISGFFSLGLGTLIGATTVTFSFNECLSSASLDYKFCKEQFNKK